jgi:hypothetical protein
MTSPGWPSGLRETSRITFEPALHLRVFGPSLGPARAKLVVEPRAYLREANPRAARNPRTAALARFASVS